MIEKRHAALLNDAGQAGVYRLPAQDEEEIVAAARDCRFAIFRISLAGVGGKEALLAALARSLAFPDWFGHNWDALEDCLTDMSWRPADGYLVVLADAHPFHAARRRDFDMTCRIFDAASNYWRSEGVPFWTLVDVHAEDAPGLRKLP